MKKILCFMLVLCITVCSGAVLAAEDYNSGEIAALLKELGIMQGDPDGSLRLDDSVSRAEFAKIAIAGSAYRNSVATNSAVSPFKDVPYTHWEAPYVKIAVTNGIITGYPDSTFRPENTVSYEEAATVCLKLLGYTAEDFGVSWPYGQTGMAANLKLNVNVAADVGEAMTRGDIMMLVYNMLNTTSKNSQNDYISIFDYTIIEDVVLIATSNEDSAVGSGKIYTSSGTYNCSDSFNFDDVGKKGDVVLKDNRELVIFVPTEQQINSYSIYQVLENDIAVYENGVASSADISTSMTVYNKSDKTTLSAMLKSLQPGDELTTYRNANGMLDYGILKTDSSKGPYIAASSEWYKTYGINVADYSVTRDGVKASTEDISMYDVVYYSEALKTVWAYSKKVTGIYESATPNKDMPSAVVVSGVTYQIESAAAYNELSSSGSINYGDTVTLLLGRNGAVAGAIKPGSGSESVIGYLFETGIKDFSSADGNKISSYYVTIISADGVKTDFRTNIDYEGFVNNIVSLKFSEGGVASLSVLSAIKGVYGKVDAKSLTVGSHRLAPNVCILDIATTHSKESAAYARLFVQRLDGLDLKSGDIISFKKNSEGEITDLFLDGVTGDMYSYGVITKATTSGSGTSVTSLTISGSGTVYNSNLNIGGINTGIGSGIGVIASGSTVKELVGINKVSGTVTELNGVSLRTKSAEYFMSPNPVVYINTAGYSYMETELAEVCDLTRYSIRAYYDRAAEDGGRVRVIVATPK